MKKTAEIRKFLIDVLDDEALTELCYDYFRDVYENFTKGMTRRQKIQLLIEYCDKHEIFPNLLVLLKKADPDLYEKSLSSWSIQPDRPSQTELFHDPGQLFISYAYEDAEFAYRLATDLQKRGWKIWIAPESIRPGEKWIQAIDRGLSESGKFLLVLTPMAVNSPWVRQETEAAIRMEVEGSVEFFPLEVQECKPPILWSNYQYVSFRNSYEVGLTNLVFRLEQHSLDHIPETDPSRSPSLLKPIIISPKVNAEKKSFWTNFIDKLPGMLKDKVDISVITGVVILTILLTILMLTVPQLSDYLILLLGSAVFVLIFLVLFREYRLRPREPDILSGKKRVIYWVPVSFTMFILIWIIVTTWIQAVLRPNTIYFVVDATDKMVPVYDQMKNFVTAIPLGSSNRTYYGLRVYGGQGSNELRCSNTSQLLKPVNDEDLSFKLDEALSSIQPGGKGSLTQAVFQAIAEDLSEVTSELTLFIFTAGIDSQCDPLESDFLEQLTKRTSPEINIAVVSIGVISEMEQRLLDQYAKAFRGYHRNVESPSEIPLIIEEDKSFRFNYAYYEYE